MSMRRLPPHERQLIDRCMDGSLPSQGLIELAFRQQVFKLSQPNVAARLESFQSQVLPNEGVVDLFRALSGVPSGDSIGKSGGKLFEFHPVISRITGGVARNFHG